MTRTHCRFGVEQENFVLHRNNAVPSHAEIDQFYDHLCGSGFRIAASNHAGRPLAVEKETVFGNLVITNDCFTHVLEVAFPPYDDLDVFQRTYVEVYSTIRTVLAELGLEIRPGSAFNPTNAILMRPKANDPDGSRLEEILSRNDTGHPLFHRALPACIASTQVSLNMRDVDAIEKLRSFYEFEPLVPLLFGNSPEFNGVRGRCVRPLAWMANFPPTYTLLGVPEKIPTSLSEYEQMREASSIRDYSFISIRTDERVEFRSACSQDTIEDILMLIRFRMAVDIASTRRATWSISNLRARFIEVCTDGPAVWCMELFDELGAIDPKLESLKQRLR